MKSKPIWFLILFLNLFSFGIICSSSSVGGQLGFDCDFENYHGNLCGWHVLGISATNNSWHRTTNSRAIESRKSGAWIFTTSQLDRSQDVNNQNRFQSLTSNVALNENATYCLTFWYYQHAIEGRSNFAVLASTPADLATVKLRLSRFDYDFGSLWKADPQKARTWTRQHVRIAPKPEMYVDGDSFPHSQHPQYLEYNLMFVGNIQEAHANIGLDDIRLFEGECPLVVDEDFCDFELNTCGWQLNGTQVWTNYVDHTTGTVVGHHVGYRYANHWSEWNKTATMTKSLSTLRMFANNDPQQQQQQKQQVCLQFFYRMDTDFVNDHIMDSYGSILVKVVENGSVEKIVSYNISLMDTYNSGNIGTWTMFRANFEAPKSATIEIESHRTVESTKVMFDDIRFIARQCEVQGNCNFETDMCGWINNQVLTRGFWSLDGYKEAERALWLRVQANSSYIEGGHLLQDRTTRSITGNYLLLPLAMLDGMKKNSLKLTSPLISNDNNNKMCFTMWYFVQTRDTLMEAIEVQLKDIRQRRTTSTHATGTHSLEWKLFSVQFDNLPERFQIQIRVLNPENILSNVGLDDIRLVPGDC